MNEFRITGHSGQGMNILSRFTLSPGWWRWTSIVLAGASVRFLMDLIFALIYRNYRVGWAAAEYAKAILIAFCIMEGIRWVNRRLDVLAPWYAHPVRRLLLQSILNTGWGLFMLLLVWNGLFRYLLHSAYEFISLSDELVVASTVAFLIMAGVLTDLAVFMLKKWRVSLAELERFKKENIEFHLQMLKTQVNPHFLFNSLNTLSSLIYTDRDIAAQFVRQLAKVYRYVLDNRSKELIQVREELQFLQSYIYLVQLRFSQNLRIVINIPEEVHHYFIAPLTLQMLIENAIKHNVVSQKKPLTVQIEWQQPDRVMVTNNLQIKPAGELSTQIGLKNIRSRYSYITAREVAVEQSDQYFRVTIPLLESVYEGVDY
jgi:sensor histidine kinase YesM